MLTVSARKLSALRWTLLAGASMIVMAGVLGPIPADAVTNTITGTTLSTMQTVTGGNSLSITSTGTVSPASAAAIYVTGTAGSLWNDGAITPASGSGIVLNGSATITGIYNTGFISGTIGLETSSNGRIGTITNSGTIAGTSVGVTISSVALGTLTNSGLIQTSGVNGALALNGTTSAGSVVNSSTGTLTSTSGFVFSVTGTATSLTLLDNAGLIKGANGARVQGTLATLTNSGTIQGTSGNALSIASTGTITSLSNTGVIAGNINDGRTTGLTIAGGTGTIYGTLTGGTITNAGTITSSGGVTFTGNTVLNSNVSANSGTGTVTNTGILYTARATTITGSYIQPSGAELQLGVVSTSVYGVLNASAGLTLTNGSVVMMAAPSGTLEAGTYTIASGGTVGTDYTGVTVTAPSSGLEASTTTTIASSKNYLVVTLSQASRLYWDGDAGGNAANSSVDGGNGTWSSAGTNWTKVDGTSNGTLTGSTITPFFQGTAGTVTVSGSVSAAGMTFATNGYLLTGGTIGLGSPAATIVSNSSVTATIASSLTGGGVYKNGVGELILSGNNNGIGNNTSVNAGTLTLMGGSALPDTKAVAVNGDGTLKLGADETVGVLTGSGVINLDSHTLTTNAEAPYNTTISGSITGTGGLVKANTGRLTLSGTGSYTGGTTITGGTLTAASATALASTGAVSVSSGATFAVNTNLTIGALSGAGDVALGANRLTLGDSTDTTVSGTIGGTGGLTKAGSGMLTLSGANSYTGTTTISSGTLAVTGTIGGVAVAPGATLSGTGTVGALTNYGTLALGGSALTAAGNITGLGAITFTIGSSGTGYIVNTTNTANYTPGAGTVTITPTLSGVTLTNGATVALIRGNSGSTAPSFTDTTLSVVSAGSETWTAAAGTAYVGTVDMNGYTIAANDTVLVATVTSPPPPPPPPPEVTTPTTPEVTTPVVTTPVVTTPTTPEVTTPVVTTPTTPVVTTPTTPTVTTGVIDGSQPTFTNEDGAVQATTVTFDGGTLKPTAPLTLTQTVKVEATNGVIDPNGSTVTLAGSITGAGQLTVNGSGTLVVSSSVSNSGGLSVQSGGVTVAGGGNVSAPVTVSGGAVTVDQGGSVSAPVTVGNGAVTVNSGGTVASSVTVESGGSAKVNGAVTGAVTVADGATLSGGGVIGGATSLSGILAPGNSPGTLSFTAPVKLNASSVYQVEIDGTGTGTGAGNHDQVVVAGASFTAGGRLTPVLRGIGGSATNSFTPSLGQSFTVVTADGGVSGRFATLDQPAGGLAAGTRLDLIYGSSAIALVATPASYADLGAAGLAQSANQRAVGTALESFRPAAGGQAADATAQALFDNLHSLSGDRIGPALNQLSGAIHADTLAADRANRRRFGRAVEARQAAGRGASGAPGPVAGVVRFLFDGKARSAAGLPEGADGGARAAAGATGLWGQPLVGRGRSGGDGNGGAVNRFTGGFMVGSDHAFDPDLTAGVALGFLRTRVKVDGGLGKGTVDSYQATAYGSWTPGAAFVDAALGYGHSRYETSRSVVFGAVAGAASGEADGDNLSAELSAGVRVALDGEAWVEPRAGLRWDRLRRGGFTETGTPLLGLTEEAATQNALRSSVALRAGTRISLGETAVEPTGLLGWEHDWRDVDASATGALNGARFTVRSSRPGRDAAVVGAGVNVAMTQRLSLQVGYLGEIRRRDGDHGLSAGLRWSW